MASMAPLWPPSYSAMKEQEFHFRSKLTSDQQRSRRSLSLPSLEPPLLPPVTRPALPCIPEAASQLPRQESNFTRGDPHSERLAEFVAHMVFILFWEGSDSYQDWLSQGTPGQSTPRLEWPLAAYQATTDFFSYTKYLLETMQISCSTALLSLFYLHRLRPRVKHLFVPGTFTVESSVDKENQSGGGQSGGSGAAGGSGSGGVGAQSGQTNPSSSRRFQYRRDPKLEYRLFTIAIVLANKYLDDNSYSNKAWSDVTGLELRKINIMEQEFMKYVDYKLVVRDREYTVWVQWLEALIHPVLENPRLRGGMNAHASLSTASSSFVNASMRQQQQQQYHAHSATTSSLSAGNGSTSSLYAHAPSHRAVKARRCSVAVVPPSASHSYMYDGSMSRAQHSMSGSTTGSSTGSAAPSLSASSSATSTSSIASGGHGRPPHSLPTPVSAQKQQVMMPSLREMPPSSMLPFAGSKSHGGAGDGYSAMTSSHGPSSHPTPQQHTYARSHHSQHPHQQQHSHQQQQQQPHYQHHRHSVGAMTPRHTLGDLSSYSLHHSNSTAMFPTSSHASHRSMNDGTPLSSPLYSMSLRHHSTGPLSSSSASQMHYTTGSSQPSLSSEHPGVYSYSHMPSSHQHHQHVQHQHPHIHTQQQQQQQQHIVHSHAHSRHSQQQPHAQSTQATRPLSMMHLPPAPTQQTTHLRRSQSMKIQPSSSSSTSLAYMHPQERGFAQDGRHFGRC